MNIGMNNQSFGAKTLYKTYSNENFNRCRSDFESRVGNGEDLEIIPLEDNNELLVLDGDDAVNFREAVYGPALVNMDPNYYTNLVSAYRRQARITNY